MQKIIRNFKPLRIWVVAPSEGDEGMSKADKTTADCESFLRYWMEWCRLTSLLWVELLK